MFYTYLKQDMQQVFLDKKRATNDRPGASSIYLCERGKKVWPFQV